MGKWIGMPVIKGIAVMDEADSPAHAADGSPLSGASGMLVEVSEAAVYQGTMPT
jgi:hypothetical protein